MIFPKTIIIPHNHLGPFVWVTRIKSIIATIIKINWRIISGNTSTHGIDSKSIPIPPLSHYIYSTTYRTEKFHKIKNIFKCISISSRGKVFTWLCYNRKLEGEFNNGIKN